MEPWILSDETMNFLEKENDYREGVCDKKYLLIIEDVKSKTSHDTHSRLQIIDDVMNDCLSFDSSNTRKKDASFVCSKKEKIVQDLINNIRGTSENVQEIIEFVSNTNNEVLIDILSDSWQQLRSEDEKKTFIKLISACPLSSRVFCKDILLRKLKEENCFYNTMEIVYSAAQWLKSQLIFHTLIPLLNNSSSPFAKETIYLERCIESFSNSQNSDFLSGYIDTIDSKLQGHHLQVLATFLENIPLNNNHLAKIVNLLSINIMDYKEDRTLGKILLLIADNVTSDTSNDVLKELNLVSSNFKGALRFRIKAALKKI